jgi:hypothetical protein
MAQAVSLDPLVAGRDTKEATSKPIAERLLEKDRVERTEGERFELSKGLHP